MPATALAATSRYYRPGTTKIYIVDTVAAGTGIPDRSELDGGVDISAEVQEVNGFMVVSESIDTPDYGSRFNSKIPGDINADDSSLVFYADVTSADIRAELTRDDNTHIVFLDEGDVEDQLMDIYPVRVGSIAKVRNRSDAATLSVEFTVTSEPVEDAAIPATA